MNYPVRYMKDGTATTRKVHGLVAVECDNQYHSRCFSAITSWAGDTIPRQNNDWHVYTNRKGTAMVEGPLADRESTQFIAGLKRRIVNTITKENRS